MSAAELSMVRVLVLQGQCSGVADGHRQLLAVRPSDRVPDRASPRAPESEIEEWLWGDRRVSIVSFELMRLSWCGCRRDLGVVSLPSWG